MACCKCCCENGTPPGECCGSPSTCCKEPDVCCGPSGSKTCCEDPRVCCGVGSGQECCPEGDVCCGEECCPPSQACCDDVCCNQGQYCCNGVCEDDPCGECGPGIQCYCWNVDTYDPGDNFGNPAYPECDAIPESEYFCGTDEEDVIAQAAAAGARRYVEYPNCEHTINGGAAYCCDGQCESAPCDP